jgi:transcriptional regulator with XRE-family HTH domain
MAAARGNTNDAGAAEKSGGKAVGEKVDFGILLRQRRLHRGLSLTEMARAVRVPVHYLEALEDGAYDALPPKPYVKGFLDAYAAQLNLDPDETWQGFEESFQAFSRSGSDEGRAIFAIFRPQGEKPHWRDWTVPIVLALAACLFLGGSRFLGRPVTEGEFAPPPEASGSRVPQEAMEIELPDAGPAEIQAGHDPDKVGGVRLSLRAESSSWLAAEVDGGPLQEWTLEEGETRTIAAKKTIVLSLGNAGALKLNVNGRELGFVGHKGEVKRNMLFAAGED